MQITHGTILQVILSPKVKNYHKEQISKGNVTNTDTDSSLHLSKCMFLLTSEMEQKFGGKQKSACSSFQN